MIFELCAGATFVATIYLWRKDRIAQKIKGYADGQNDFRLSLKAKHPLATVVDIAPASMVQKQHPSLYAALNNFDGAVYRLMMAIDSHLSTLSHREALHFTDALKQGDLSVFKDKSQLSELVATLYQFYALLPDNNTGSADFDAFTLAVNVSVKHDKKSSSSALYVHNAEFKNKI